jgi:hypothetical protein
MFLAEVGFSTRALKFGPFIAFQNHEGSGFSAQVAPIRTAGGSSPQITQRAGQ